MDIEKNKKLPFLDLLVTKKADNTLGNQVYRKPTHTDRYLHVESHHHLAQKQSITQAHTKKVIYAGVLTILIFCILSR